MRRPSLLASPRPGASNRVRVTMLAVFALHNAEEVACAGRGIGPDERFLARLGLGRADYRPDRMSIATGLLTAAVTLATLAGSRGPRSSSGPILAITAAGALAVNAVGHLLQVVVRRRYNPGSVTAPLLLVVSLDAVRTTALAAGATRARVASAVVAGGVLSLPAMVAALRLARALRPSSS